MAHATEPGPPTAHRLWIPPAPAPPSPRSEEDALHAGAFAIDAWDLGDGLVMYVGPARSRALLEVGVVGWHGEIAIVHAMSAQEGS